MRLRQTQIAEDSDENESTRVEQDSSHDTHVESYVVSPSPSPSSTPSTMSSGSCKRRRCSTADQSLLLHYLSFKKQQQQRPSDTIATFFSSLAEIVKTFPKHLQISVKQPVFRVVTETEQSLMINPTAPSTQLNQYPNSGFNYDRTGHPPVYRNI